MIKFLMEVERGATIGLKAALTGYMCVAFVVVCAVAPLPFLFIGGDVLTFGLNAIWGS